MLPGFWKTDWKFFLNVWDILGGQWAQLENKNSQKWCSLKSNKGFVKWLHEDMVLFPIRKIVRPSCSESVVNLGNSWSLRHDSAFDGPDYHASPGSKTPKRTHTFCTRSDWRHDLRTAGNLQAPDPAITQHADVVLLHPLPGAIYLCQTALTKAHSSIVHFSSQLQRSLSNFNISNGSMKILQLWGKLISYPLFFTKAFFKWT